MVVFLQVAADSESSTSTYILPSRRRTPAAGKGIGLVSRGIQAGRRRIHKFVPVEFMVFDVETKKNSHYWKSAKNEKNKPEITVDTQMQIIIRKH